MDAVVAERLTASPRIYNIYGNCGIGIMAQYFPHGDLETIAVPGSGYLWDSDTNNETFSYNNLTGLEKLQMSLHMAESLADLHGYPGGVIVHQDVVRVSVVSKPLQCNDFVSCPFYSSQ